MNWPKEYETLVLNQMVIMNVLIFLLRSNQEVRDDVANHLGRYLDKLIKETGFDPHLWRNTDA